MIIIIFLMLNQYNGVYNISKSDKETFEAKGFVIKINI